MSGIMSAIGGLFAPKVKMPEVKTPQMPDPENPALKLAAKRKMADRNKEGRAGTIFTSGSSGAYTGSNLAATA